LDFDNLRGRFLAAGGEKEGESEKKAGGSFHRRRSSTESGELAIPNVEMAAMGENFEDGGGGSKYKHASVAVKEANRTTVLQRSDSSSREVPRRVMKERARRSEALAHFLRLFNSMRMHMYIVGTLILGKVGGCTVWDLLSGEAV
jgi:hypothetical protein